MKVHLIDGTYELFRSHFALPSISAPSGRPVGAVRGLIQTLLLLLRGEGVTHVGCAFDHVIESFRNDLFAGYKTGSGVPEDLMSQFELAERAASSLGIVIWPMVEFEADDAIATATDRWRDDPGVEQVVICSPDKDLMQLAQGDKVVSWDRRKDVVLNETAVVQKFNVSPDSIPDYLAMVGDSADGIPGIPKWGAKSTSEMLRCYRHIEQIPSDPMTWDVKPRGTEAMARSLAENRQEANLYRTLTTLRRDAPITETLDDLEWKGVRRQDYLDLCEELGFQRLKDLPHKWTE